MTFVNDGRELIASFLAGNSQTAPTHIAFGTDATTPNIEDSTLTNEFVRIANTETVLNGREIQFTTIMTTTQGNGTTFKEMGLFNASSNGTLFARSVFVDINKNNTFEIEATFIFRVD